MSRAVALVACALTCAIWSGGVGEAVAAAAARAPAGAAIDPDRAREQARDVLAQRRFHPTTLPSPLRRVRERIGEAVRQLGRPFQAAYEWMPAALAIVLAASLLAAAAALVVRLGVRRRQAGLTGERVVGTDGRREPSAARLRAQADAAERRGELEAALRLRFRAGLVDLDARELIELRPALTNHELLRAVPSPTLAALVDGFEAVAYGGRDAQADDVRRARDGWPRVAEEAGPR